MPFEFVAEHEAVPRCHRRAPARDFASRDPLPPDRLGGMAIARGIETQRRETGRIRSDLIPVGPASVHGEKKKRWAASPMGSERCGEPHDWSRTIARRFGTKTSNRWIGYGVCRPRGRESTPSPPETSTGNRGPNSRKFTKGLREIGMMEWGNDGRECKAWEREASASPRRPSRVCA